MKEVTRFKMEVTIYLLSEFFDLTVLGDYYTNGSYGINISSQYKKRYSNSGNFSVRYENLINSERGLPRLW